MHPGRQECTVGSIRNKQYRHPLFGHGKEAPSSLSPSFSTVGEGTLEHGPKDHTRLH